MSHLDRYKHRERFVADERSAIGFIPAAEVGVQSADKNRLKRISRSCGVYFWRTFTASSHEDSPLQSVTLAHAIAEALDRQIPNLVVTRVTEVFSPEHVALLSHHLGRMRIRFLQAEELEATGTAMESNKVGKPTFDPTISQQWSRLKRLITIRQNRVRLGRPRFRETNQMAILSRIIELARTLPPTKWQKRKERIVKRRSPQQIADVLNQEGLFRSGANAWTDDAVRAVLKKHRPNWLR